MKKNLILGLLNNYTYIDVNHFVLSLSKTGYTGDLVLFVGNNTGQLSIRSFKNNHVTIEHFDSLSSLPKDCKAADSFKFRQPINYFNYRHYLYYDFLTKHREDYDYVMLADITDIIFQGDPFGFDIGDNLCCAIENKLFKDCSYYDEDMRSLYGEEMLRYIGDKYISCAGTVWGSVATILRYEEIMLDEIVRMDNARDGYDQTVHNYMIYTDKIGPIKYLDNAGDVVCTLGFELDYIISDNGDILNKNKLKPRVVHQYDLKPDAVASVNKMYPKNPTLSKILKADLFVHKAWTKLLRRN